MDSAQAAAGAGEDGGVAAAALRGGGGLPVPRQPLPAAYRRRCGHAPRVRQPAFRAGGIARGQRKRDVREVVPRPGGGHHRRGGGALRQAFGHRVRPGEDNRRAPALGFVQRRGEPVLHLAAGDGPAGGGGLRGGPRAGAHQAPQPLAGVLGRGGAHAAGLPGKAPVAAGQRAHAHAVNGDRYIGLCVPKNTCHASADLATRLSTMYTFSPNR